MQDKRLHIDNDFVEQAWRNMNSLLDKEMPVIDKRKRRSAIWLWWGIGFALLTLGTALGLTLKTEKKSIPGASQPIKTAVANSSELQVPSTDLQGQASQEIVLEEKVRNESQSILASDDTPSNPKQESNRQRLTKPNETEAKRTIPPPSKSTTPANSADSSLSNEANSSVFNQTTEANGDSFEPAISILKNTLRPIPAPTTEQRTVPAKVLVDKNRNWDFGVAMNGMSAITNYGAGFSAGFFASKTMKNPRRSISVGLGYSYLEQPLSVVVSAQESQVVPNGNVTEDVEYGYLDSSGKLLDSDESNQAIVRTDYDQPLRLHYANIPVTLSHRVGARLSLSAGVQASVLLHSKSDFVQASGAFGSASPTLNEALSSLEKPFKVSLFDLSATGSVGYLLSSKASLEFGYSLGLIDVLPNNNFDDKNRMAYLGLWYQF